MALPGDLNGSERKGPVVLRHPLKPHNPLRAADLKPEAIRQHHASSLDLSRFTNEVGGSLFKIPPK